MCGNPDMIEKVKIYFKIAHTNGTKPFLGFVSYILRHV